MNHRRPPERSSTVVVAGLVAALLTLAVSGCAATSRNTAATGTDGQVAAGALTIIVPRGGHEAAIIRTFRHDHPEVTLRIIWCDGDDEAAARLEDGLAADVVAVTSQETLPLLVSRRLVQAIDTRRLTEWSSLVPSARRFPAFMSDGCAYAVPTGLDLIGIALATGKDPTSTLWRTSSHPG